MDTMHDLVARFGPPLAGGALLGLASSLVLAMHGRIAGIAGLFGGLFLPGHDARPFRLWFVAGLLVAGAGLAFLYPSLFSSERVPGLAVVGVAGLLVGYGTRLGGGCTSGHGVCGLSRLSVRSLVATVTFMVAGMLTVLAVRLLAGPR
jgi:uncharacterized membrane protein YedE/YeeE